MAYKLLDNLEVELNKITPQALISLRELELLEVDKNVADFTSNLVKLFIEKSEQPKFNKLLKTIFVLDKDLTDEEFIKIDLAEVTKGLFDFFAQLTRPILKSIGLDRILPNSS